MRLWVKSHQILAEYVGQIFFFLFVYSSFRFEDIRAYKPHVLGEGTSKFFTSIFKDRCCRHAEKFGSVAFGDRTCDTRKKRENVLGESGSKLSVKSQPFVGECSLYFVVSYICFQGC